MEQVVVPLKELHPGLKSALRTPTRMLRTEMEIIQRLRALYKQGEEPSTFLQGSGTLPSLAESERELVERYIDEYRPQRTWAQIADMMGIERSTLRRKRNKYDL